MDIEKHVMKNTASAKRPGYVLASVVALIFLMTILLGAAISCLEYSSGVMEAYLSRFQARNALESMSNLSLRWLSAEVRRGARPGARAVGSGETLTGPDSLLIFTSNDFGGCEVKIYDLGYDAGKIAAAARTSRIFPPSFPGGYMIRAVAVRNKLAPLTLESVYTVTSGDEKLVYSRELFRN